MGWKPSDDPDADELRNKNLNKNAEEIENAPEVQNAVDDTEKKEE